MPVFLAVLLAASIRSNPQGFIIDVDAAKGMIKFGDVHRRLQLTLDFSEKCVVTSMVVDGHETAAPENGAVSGIKVGEQWFTTASQMPTPTLTFGPTAVTVSNIEFGGGGVKVVESWKFSPVGEGIEWHIDRRYLTRGTLADSCNPGLNFKTMSSWTGALLGTGGVAWCKLFDSPNATYGVHTESASLWNAGNDAYLQIGSRQEVGRPMAIRFARQTNNEFSMAFEPSPHRLLTKHGQARFLKTAQDIWMPWRVDETQPTSVTYTLRARSYSRVADRGELKGIDGIAVRDILSTIGRIGVIDDKIMGSNGWYSGYAVLHEPWLSQIGLAIDDPKFTANMSASLDYARDNAIEPDGMVKSRWAYDSGDSEPGTYDPTGFYECQWGRLMDTQTSYVLNVSQQFDLNGDTGWLQGQKAACESAIDYLLRRDTNGNHLVEMATDSWTQHKSSDWLDITWASFESAFVNAQLYRALLVWSENERVLGDSKLAAYYKDYAAQLKTSFNKPTTQGGFWDAKNKWYAYWREKDGVIHGDNLVLPVNLMAIAFGLCDDPVHRDAILNIVERKMAHENLFCWPVNIFAYRPNETGNPTFPDYENGDIFLAWAEIGMEAYAESRPDIAVKYLKNVLLKYKKDGLAFQRYLRRDQSGAGDDILANNCSAVVGLYQDIYGIHPRFNRLALDPRITPEMSGTRLNYRLREQQMTITLRPGRYEIACSGKTISSAEAFGVNFGAHGADYFRRDEADPSFSINVADKGHAELAIDSWGRTFRWTLSGLRPHVRVSQTIHKLIPYRTYRLLIPNTQAVEMKADSEGNAKFVFTPDTRSPVTFRFLPAGSK